MIVGCVWFFDWVSCYFDRVSCYFDISVASRKDQGRLQP